MATLNNKKRKPNPTKQVEYHDTAFTLPNGCPVDNPVKTEKVKQTNGKSIEVSQLLQDIYLIDGISHITRERIPERFVHAKGAGAYGEFEVTNDEIKEYTSADFLQKKNRKTPLLIRFSTTAGEKGSADTVRDTRGLAFKLYTNEGNLDWAFFHPAVFPIRDPGKFTSLVHATKREPASNAGDPTMFWNFFNHNLEGYNAVTRFFSDEGTPKSYSNVTISSVNTYSFVKNDGTYSFVRLTLDPVYKADPFRLAEAVEMAGKDPDFHTRTLFTTIKTCNNKKKHHEDEITEIEAKLKKSPSADVKKKLEKDRADKRKAIEQLPYPSWKVNAQIITPAQATAASVNIFDPTKVLPTDLGVTKEIGKITLNRNPENFFAEIEQAAFAPANFVPGWDMSPDPILQIRMFPYGDTQRHRLGPNADQLPVNRPNKQWNPTRRDGQSNTFNYEDIPNYIADSSKTSATPGTNTLHSFVGDRWAKNGVTVERAINAVDADELEQPWKYYETDLAKDPVVKDPTYAEKAKEKKISYNQWGFVFNVAQHLSGAKKEVREDTYAVFKKMDKTHQMSGKPTPQNLGVLIEAETEKAVKDRHETVSDIPKSIGYSARVDHPGAPAPPVAQSMDTVANAYKSMADAADD